MDHRSPSPDNANERHHDRTKQQSQDTSPNNISLGQHMRMFGQRSDQQARTNEASTSGSDGQSARQEKSDNEQLHCQADSHYARDDYGQAKPLYKSLLPLYVQEFGSGDIKTALVQNSLANIYKKSCKHEKAKALYKCVLPIYKREFGEDNPKTKKVQKNLESIAEKLGQPLESSSGRKLGNYQLLKPLGAGGFGDVYLGERIDAPEKKVAVKMLKPTHLTNPEIVKNFREEAGNLLKLKHEHIVNVEEVGTAEDNAPYLVMEYAPNGTLRDVHPKDTCVPLWKVVKYVNQIASALQYMHDEKLMHLDLKPENVLLGAEGQLLLSDFGLVQTVHNTVSQPTLNMGTCEYAAPEHFHYGKPCKESDQYALGVMVYEWLSGKRPFFLHSPHPNHNVRFEPLHGRIPGISRKIEQVVFKALKPKPEGRFTVERNPGERIPSVKAFAEAFEQACKKLFKSSKFLKSSEGIDFLKSGEGIDFLKSREGIGFLKSREGIGFLKSREGVDFLKSQEGIDFLKSGEGIGFLKSREGIGFLKSREGIGFLEESPAVREILKNSVDSAEKQKGQVQEQVAPTNRVLQEEGSSSLSTGWEEINSQDAHSDNALRNPNRPDDTVTGSSDEHSVTITSSLAKGEASSPSTGWEEISHNAEQQRPDHIEKQTGVSRSIRAEDLARMSLNEQISWCMRGGLAEALGPDGDSSFAPIILDMLRDNQIDNPMRCGIAHGMGTILVAHYNEGISKKMLDMLHNEQIYSVVRRDIAQGMFTILASHYNEGMAKKMLDMLHNEQIYSVVRRDIAQGMGTILAAHYNEDMAKKMLAMLRNSHIDNMVRRDIAHGMGTILAAHYNEDMAKKMLDILRNIHIDNLVRCGIAHGMCTILVANYKEGIAKKMLDILPYGSRDNLVCRDIVQGMFTILAAHYNEGMAQKMMAMLHYRQIDSVLRHDIAQGMFTILASHYTAHHNAQEMLAMLHNRLIDNPARSGIAQGIGIILSEHYNEGMVQKMLAMLHTSHIDSVVRSGIAQGMGTILASHYNEGMAQKMMAMLHASHIDNMVRSSIAQGMGTILASHYNEGMAQKMLDMLYNSRIDYLVRRSISHGIVTILSVHYNEGMAQKMLDMLHNSQIDWRVRDGIVQGIGTILAENYNEGMAQKMLDMLYNSQIDWKVRDSITKAMSTILLVHYNEGMAQKMLDMLHNSQIDIVMRGDIAQVMVTILASHYNEGMAQKMLDMLYNGQIGCRVRGDIAHGISTIIKIRTKTQIDNDMRFSESRSLERTRRDAPATSSSEASSIISQHS